MCIFELEWIQKKNIVMARIIQKYFTGIDSTFITIKHRIPAKRTDIFANCKENGGGGENGSRRFKN